MRGANCCLSIAVSFIQNDKMLAKLQTSFCPPPVGKILRTTRDLQQIAGPWDNELPLLPYFLGKYWRYLKTENRYVWGKLLSIHCCVIHKKFIKYTQSYILRFGRQLDRNLVTKVRYRIFSVCIKDKWKRKPCTSVWGNFVCPSL